jgi:hypothetical protein
MLRDLVYTRYIRDPAGESISGYTSEKSLKDIFEYHQIGKVYRIAKDTWLVVEKDQVLIYRRPTK